METIENLFRRGRRQSCKTHFRAIFQKLFRTLKSGLKVFPVSAMISEFNRRLFMPYLEYDDHGTIRRVNLAGDRETFIGRDQQCTICLAGVPPGEPPSLRCLFQYESECLRPGGYALHERDEAQRGENQPERCDIERRRPDSGRRRSRFTFRGEQEQPDVKLVVPLNIDPLSYGLPSFPRLLPECRKITLRT